LARERAAWNKSYDLVIGIDEAGRGPLAGPVVAAAVALTKPIRILPPLLARARDSKKLSPHQRENLYDLLTHHEKIVWKVAKIGPKTIDRLNILEASKIAMAKAVNKIITRLADPRPRILCLIDGNFAINISHPQKSIIGGDDLVFSIAAASIIAKVTRDRMMKKLDRKHPEYGFAQHKGYPTKKHLAAIARHGLLPEHRKTFSPCVKVFKKV